jgi:hypothetical protein
MIALHSTAASPAIRLADSRPPVAGRVFVRSENGGGEGVIRIILFESREFGNFMMISLFYTFTPKQTDDAAMLCNETWC